MAKRNDRRSSDTTSRTANSESLSALEQQVIGIAEQLGRIAGSAQARASLWMDQPRFQKQLSSIRKRVAHLLVRLGSSSNIGTATPSRARSRAKVAAPGKKHRQPPVLTRGVKHSDETISKAAATRRRRTGRPRQG